MKKPPITQACLSCRARKIKCSGDLPCTHCKYLHTGCQYVRSRRGGRRKRGEIDRIARGSSEPFITSDEAELLTPNKESSSVSPHQLSSVENADDVGSSTLPDGTKRDREHPSSLGLLKTPEELEIISLYVSLMMLLMTGYYDTTGTFIRRIHFFPRL